MTDPHDQSRDPASGPVPPQPGAEDPTLQQPVPGGTAHLDQPVPPAETPPAGIPAAGTPAAPQTGEHAQQAPPPPPGYAPWGTPPPQPARPGGFRRFVGHKATQLVAVGVLGALVGGGVVAGIAVAHEGSGPGRAGIHRTHPGNGNGGNGNGGNFHFRGGGQRGNGNGN